MTWVTSASYAKTSSVARWLLSRALSGLCPWATCVFRFRTSSFLKHLCIYLQAASSSLGDRIPKPQGLQEILSGHTTICAQCAGPSDGPDGVSVCACVNRAAGMRAVQQLAGP